MPPFLLVIIAIIIISTIVGAVAKLLNNLNEANANAANAANAARARQGAPAGAGGGGNSGPVLRQSTTDMDRFLAEIDRLRKKSAEAPPPPQNQAPAAPVVQPAKQQDRPRPRVVAELADNRDTGFPQAAPAPTTGPKPGDLPMASVVNLPSGTGAPATRVTRFANRPRAVAKTPFAKNLTTLLGSGHGLALAIVLQEILGPASSKKG